jgi:hypothetical protein
VHQLFTGGAGDECPNDVGVCDVGELGALLGEAYDEVSERFVKLLVAAPEVLEVAKAHICALEFSDEDPD